jgi:hypothetical protein
MLMAVSAEDPLWKLDLRGKVSYHSRKEDAENYFEQRGYTIATNCNFDSDIEELRGKLGKLAQRN